MTDRLEIPVLCYGLRTDFQANLFEGSAALLALADDLQRQFQQLRDQIVQSRAGLARLNADYNVTRADFDGFFTQQDADRQALIVKVISVRAQIGVNRSLS